MPRKGVHTYPEQEFGVGMHVGRGFARGTTVRPAARRGAIAGHIFEGGVAEGDWCFLDLCAYREGKEHKAG